MSRNHIIITIGIMLGLFLASIEGTIVSTAMPTIVAQLGGLSIYSWVFSAYMLTSTSTTPIYGKLADMYGIRRVYMVAVAIFLVGSTLSGTAQSMEQLVFYRLLQGLGAGGLLPLAFTIIGMIFTLEQRAKMQGLFSGVWGVSSLVGPLIGGFIVDKLTWHWVFFLNLPFGIAAAALLWRNLQDTKPSGVKRSIDFSGVFLLVGGIVAFLLALLEGPVSGWTSPLVMGAGVVSIVLLASFIWNELKVSEPIIPPALFKDRLFAIGSTHGFLTGVAMFGSISFLPLFAQGVLGLNATAAGAVLTPALLMWTVSSIIGGRLLLTYGYRKVAIGSMLIMTLGAFMLSRLSGETQQWQLLIYSGLLGCGMGAGVTAFLISIQSSVARNQLGAATSTLQFTRSMGGTIGVSIFGTVMAAKLSQGIAAAGLAGKVDPQALLEVGAQIPAEILLALKDSLAEAIALVFLLAFAATLTALVAIVVLAPRLATNREQSSTHEAVREPAIEI
jgi:EmrB/QacA subfamily drug resistance transporter